MNSNTVFDDAAIERLNGGPGLDWFWVTPSGPFADIITDSNLQQEKVN